MGTRGLAPRGQRGRDVMPTTNLHLVPRIRMSEAKHPLAPFKPSRHETGQPKFTYYTSIRAWTAEYSSPRISLGYNIYSRNRIIHKIQRHLVSHSVIQFAGRERNIPDIYVQCYSKPSSDAKINAIIFQKRKMPLYLSPITLQWHMKYTGIFKHTYLYPQHGLFHSGVYQLIAITRLLHLTSLTPVFAAPNFTFTNKYHYCYLQFSCSLT